MIKRLLKKITSRTRVPSSVDPAVFDDPMALKIEWSPTQSRGGSYKRRLIKSDFTQYRFKTKGLSMFVPFLFWIIPGVIIYKSGAFRNFEQMNIPTVSQLVLLLIIFIIFYRTSQNLKPTVFDRPSGLFWKGWKRPLEKNNKNSCLLRDIYALQMVCKKVSGGEHDTTYYELNIVLKNKERVYVIDYFKVDDLIEDGEKLARFLNVPFWNGVKIKRGDELMEEAQAKYLAKKNRKYNPEE